RRMTMGQGHNESPCWAPNSRHLTFASNRSGGWHIYIMLDDGSNQRPLTASGRNTQPDWGPFPANRAE
ncbi:PD40 domain-containing protein, partial [Candidatus Poribacteria bacterium]|nr:PD40 domain-containing protein [Candidatus Poribacteria bacterium]